MSAVDSVSRKGKVGEEDARGVRGSERGVVGLPVSGLSTPSLFLRSPECPMFPFGRLRLILLFKPPSVLLLCSPNSMPQVLGVTPMCGTTQLPLSGGILIGAIKSSLFSVFKSLPSLSQCPEALEGEVGGVADVDADSTGKGFLYIFAAVVVGVERPIPSFSGSCWRLSSVLLLANAARPAAAKTSVIPAN